MKVTANANEKYPYYIKVNKQQNTVTIYGLDDKGKYTVPIKAMTCSVGTATPLGVFKTPIKYRWKLLNGDVWGQYSTRVVGGILFHSVYYYKLDPTTLSWSQYNKLGTTASQGCIRLTVEDAKWIYDNCPIGTTVEIYNDKNPGPLGKPERIKLQAGTGWDPTDPSKDNPFKDKKPVIKGAKNLKVEWGQDIDLLSGIKATSTTGFDITSKIKVEGDVNVYKLGKQKIKYTVTDAINRTAEKTITVTVTEIKEAPRLEGVSNRGINSSTVVDRKFALKGVTAYLSSKELPNDAIEVEIDNSKEGEYQITYSITASNGLSTVKEATFYVDYTAPILSGVSHRELTKEQLGFSKSKMTKLALEGITVSDDFSNITTDDIKVTVKAKEDYGFTITYLVKDEAGNETKEITQFTYFEDVRIDGVSNYYNLPYGTKITKPFVREGITALDSEGNDITESMLVTVSSYVNEVYKVTYKVTNDDGKLIQVVCYFTVMLEPEMEEDEVNPGSLDEEVIADTDNSEGSDGKVDADTEVSEGSAGKVDANTDDSEASDGEVDTDAVD